MTWETDDDRARRLEEVIHYPPPSRRMGHKLILGNCCSEKGAKGTT